MILFRWTPTALWASTSGAFARQLPAGDEDSQAASGTKGQSWAPAGLLASSHRVLAFGQGALDQLRSSVQQASPLRQLGEQEQQDEGTPSAAADGASKAASAAGSWWMPWRTAPAHNVPGAAQVCLSLILQQDQNGIQGVHIDLKDLQSMHLSCEAQPVRLGMRNVRSTADDSHCMQAPSPSKARPWLPSGASRWMSGSAQDDAVKLQVTVAGQGLAGCTSARLQTPDGSFHEARISAAPAVSLSLLTEPQQAQAPRTPSKLRLQLLRQKLMDAGRHTWQRWQSRTAPSAQPASESSKEQLLLEVKLKHADAQAIVSSSSQHEASDSRASSLLKVHLRSDFEVVHSEVMLSRRQVWVLGSSSHTVDRVLQLLGAASAKHAFLPGVKTAAADAVSYTCLVAANRDLAAVAQLASQHLQGLQALGDHGQTNAVGADAREGDSGLRSKAHVVTSSQMLHPLYKSLGMLSPAYRAQAVQAARLVSTALASTLQQARLTASQTSSAARGRLQRLRHRHAVLAMQQQSRPDMIMLCLPGHSSVMGGRKRQPAPAAAHSVIEFAAVTSLVEDAHQAGIPALVILLTEDRDLAIYKAECAKALQLSDTDRLVILGGKPGSIEAFNLKRAIFDCLDSSKQSPRIPSKL